MTRRLVALSTQRPWAPITCWLAVLAIAAPFVTGLGPALKSGGFSDPRGTSTLAATELQRAFHVAPHALIVVLHADRGEVLGTVTPARRVLATLPFHTTIEDYRGMPQWLSRDHRTTILQVGLNADDTAAQNLVGVLRARLARALTGRAVTHQVTGAPALDHDLDVASQRDVERAELIAFPALFLVLLAVFRSIAAVMVPLAMAAVTIVISDAIGALIARCTNISILFSSAVTMIGLAVAVDYSLFMITRFREELAAGADERAALNRTLETAGKSVVFSGVVVVIALSVLFITRIMVFSSVALGGVLATLVALAVSVTLLPAVLRLLGTRVAGKKRVLARRGERQSALVGLAAPLYRRPVSVLVACGAMFALLAAPVIGIRLQVPVASAAILPASSEARAGIERVSKDLALPDLFPLQIVLQQPAAAGAERLRATAAWVAAEAARVPDVSRVQTGTSLAELGTPPSDTLVARVVVTPRSGPDSTQTHQLVADLRGRLRGVVGAHLAGDTVESVDFDDAVKRSVPFLVAMVIAATYVTLALAFRSWILPLLTLTFNALVISASLGVLVALFQGGVDAAIDSITPILLFAVTFGLSMDYMVIMVSRVRELHLAGLTAREATLHGVGKTAGMVNGAAVIMIAVFISFGTADVSIVRQLGIGLAVAIALDAWVIRLLVMPAALLIGGERIWAAPAIRRSSRAKSNRAHLKSSVVSGTPPARSNSQRKQP